ncbi:uncharacterized protein TRIADDRAFT_59404 [Trichoplax adhaerens]|uniref:Coiled-coil domain-containing protein 24 n=1 Tax=Trichoplax adhaerens TaxID=10228 RepID=B3S4Z4_TRIAD|nr:hypothetical protein TRIADDRAFT_59404 [Trichoplax adhaerens]EDV22297.1 hypothetical protein TRIADDRAFT_59404 [Trichoplax adhaerens]|eukprot:XP_002115452.1 hypothetical protein TRIADDRAFT_59404 [Trichoplax adhaerens]
MTSPINTPFQLASSAWQVIQSVAPASEIDEITSIIGRSLTQQVEEIRQEAGYLLDIWRDLRQQTDSLVAENPTKLLPEPPELRNRLKQEITMLLDILKQKDDMAHKQDMLQDYKHIVSYVTQPRENQVSPLSRPQSACSSLDNREVPVVQSSCSGRSSAANSMLDDEVKSISDRVNITDIDSIAEALRNLLEEEYESLKGDIEYLQSCLEDESSFQHETNSIPTEPTLSELRKFGTQLERSVLSTVGKPPIPDKTIKNVDPLSKPASIPRRLHSINKTKNDGSDLSHKMELVKITNATADGNINKLTRSTSNKLPANIAPRPPATRPKATVKSNSAGSRRKLAVYFDPKDHDKKALSDGNQTTPVLMDHLKYDPTSKSFLASRDRQYSA